MPETLAPPNHAALAALPVAVLDLETTGLDVRRDRILQIGVVVMQGSRILDTPRVDQLIDPGEPIAEGTLPRRLIQPLVVADIRKANVRRVVPELIDPIRRQVLRVERRLELIEQRALEIPRQESSLGGRRHRHALLASLL